MHGIEFLPVLTDNGEIEFKRPYQCTIIENYEGLFDLMPLYSIQKVLSRYFIHPYLFNSTNTNEDKQLAIKQLVSLGVKKFDLDDLLSLLNANFNLSQDIDSAQMENITKWLQLCEEFSSKLSSNELSKFLHDLKRIKFIPLVSSHERKELFAFESVQTVYFPIFDYDKYNLNRDILKLIENELCLIDLNSLAIDYNSSLIKFIAHMGECRKNFVEKIKLATDIIKSC